MLKCLLHFSISVRATCGCAAYWHEQVYLRQFSEVLMGNMRLRRIET